MNTGLCYESMLVENLFIEKHDKKVDVLIARNKTNTYKWKFVVTTNIKTNDKLIKRSKEIAGYFEVDYIDRKN